MARHRLDPPPRRPLITRPDSGTVDVLVLLGGAVGVPAVVLPIVVFAYSGLPNVVAPLLVLTWWSLP